MNIGKSEFYFGSDFQDTRREMLTEFVAMWLDSGRTVDAVYELRLYCRNCDTVASTVALSPPATLCIEMFRAWKGISLSILLLQRDCQNFLLWIRSPDLGWLSDSERELKFGKTGEFARILKMENGKHTMLQECKPHAFRAGLPSIPPNLLRVDAAHEPSRFVSKHFICLLKIICNHWLSRIIYQLLWTEFHGDLGKRPLVGLLLGTKRTLWALSWMKWLGHEFWMHYECYGVTKCDDALVN